MNDAELCYLPATEALAAFRARTLSPHELMQAVIVRAEVIARPVNCEDRRGSGSPAAT